KVGRYVNGNLKFSTKQIQKIGRAFYGKTYYKETSIPAKSRVGRKKKIVRTVKAMGPVFVAAPRKIKAETIIRRVQVALNNIAAVHEHESEINRLAIRIKRYIVKPEKSKGL